MHATNRDALLVLLLHGTLALGSAAALDRSSRLTVRVATPEGQPVNGAKVWVHNSGATIKIRTGRQGKASCRIIPQGTIRIQAYADGYETSTQSLDVHEGDKALDIQMTLMPPHEVVQSDPHPSPFEVKFEHCASGQCTVGFVRDPSNRSFGMYFLQTKPPSHQPVVIRVPGAPETASWDLSNLGLAVLTKIGINEARVEFTKDGDAELFVQDALSKAGDGGKVFLRVHLSAITTQELGELKVFDEPLEEHRAP